MSFDEIIRMMENANDYIDLYDAVAYIVDDDLRTDVEQLIGQCEDDGDSVDTAYSVVTSDLLDTKVYDLNESVSMDNQESKTLETYLQDIADVSNDKDLLNILDEMEEDKNIENSFVENIRQLFRNNRFMPLNSKIDAILRFTDKYNNIAEKEVKTESVSNNDKTNKDVSEEEVDIDSLEVIKDRIGQQMTVGKFNKFLQTTFNQYNKLFLLESDLYSMDLSQVQTLSIDEDGVTYDIDYSIVDVDNGIIEIEDASIEE